MKADEFIEILKGNYAYLFEVETCDVFVSTLSKGNEVTAVIYLRENAEALEIITTSHELSLCGLGHMLMAKTLQKHPARDPQQLTLLAQALAEAWPYASVGRVIGQVIRSDGD